MSGTMETVGVIEIVDPDEGEFEDEESEDEESEEEDEELIPSPRVSAAQAGVVGSVADGDEELNGFDMEGLNCSICTEPWTSGGEHQICCLPCGHIYGLSCIKKWIRIRQRSSAGKCPQCNRRCTLKDVRVLYATRLCVLDAKLQKKVQTLEAKCASLKQKVNAECCKKEVEAQEREADLHLKVEKLTEKAKYMERLLKDRLFTSYQGYQRKVINGNGSGSEVCSGVFMLQREFQVDGGRCFDMDASGEVMIVARRLNGMGGTSLLTKISLVAPNEREDIHLPTNTKAVKALCVRPCTRLALFASLGKKLSIVSTESNNTVLDYDLPAPAWSCTWDISSSHHVYAGLQNGMVLGFDTRQTKTPLESKSGLSCNPVHTLISVAPDSSSGTRTLLTASQIGICEWNFGSSEERPYLIPESTKQGWVCISVAHSGGDDIVASFRPKIEMSMAVSQSPSMSCGVEGCHIFYKRSGAGSYEKTGCLVGEMDSIRLPKCNIIKKGNHSPMFIAANEVTSELVLHDINRLGIVERLRTPKKQKIWDVKCWNSCVMGCLSGDVVQLYT